MKKIFLSLLITVIIFSFTNKLVAQGCVAIRNTGGLCTMQHPNETSDKWLFGVNNRYYKSYKHFIGTDEQKQRQQLGTEVINHAYTMDLSLTRILNKRWSVAIDVPVEANSRSSLYEHNNVGRFSTHSFGVGDMRFAVYSWFCDPAKFHRGNVQVGLGIKFATGDYKYQDYFHTSDTSKILGPVDQSIQLGDGGTGFTTEINAYYNFSRVISVYGNFYYLINPREQNGVSTSRGGIPSALTIAIGSDVMSVPDQYMIRGGATFNADNWMFSAGIRDECLPVHDLIGGSQGFRRPGYIISAEPGVTYKFKKVTAYTYVPVAIVRNRTQSVPDKNRTALTSVYAHGDAAFADYAINIGLAVKF
ncbi:MAG: hypothetical protein ACR2FN_14385 [Chitinophagaceae bacterium]